MVKILYAKIAEESGLNVVQRGVDRLPKQMVERMSSFRFNRDKLLYLFGKLLLEDGFKEQGIEEPILDKIKIDNFGRPFLPAYENIDFNISHSGEYAVVAIGEHCRVGVDIEKIVNIDFQEVYSVMSEVQWKKILTDEEPLLKFYEYWTIKESILKATGIGIATQLDMIEIDKNSVSFQEARWYIHELKIVKGYSCHFACNEADSNYIIQNIDYYDN